MASHASSSLGAPTVPQELYRLKAFGKRENITSEESFAKFLADVDSKMLESAGNNVHVTPGVLVSSSMMRGVGGDPPSASTNPSPLSLSSTPCSGATSVRILPIFSKGIASPKVGERELPPPMSLDQVNDGLRQLGILDAMEQWRDVLRQWFSSLLLKPLIHKIETSHWQVWHQQSMLCCMLSRLVVTCFTE